MLIAINLALSLFLHNIIAWQDHIGGLLTGALLTGAYAYAPRKNRAALQILATIAVVAALVIAIAIRNGQLTAATGSKTAQRHVVARPTPTMMSTKPTTRFHEPRADMPGNDPWVM